MIPELLEKSRECRKRARELFERSKRMIEQAQKTLESTERRELYLLAMENNQIAYEYEAEARKLHRQYAACEKLKRERSEMTGH